MASVSMYTDLLEAALAEVIPGGRPTSFHQALAEVVRRRKLLASSGWHEVGRPSVSVALADEVAYDVALIRLARCVDVDCDPGSFGRPQGERQKVERTLASGGVVLG